MRSVLLITAVIVVVTSCGVANAQRAERGRGGDLGWSRYVDSRFGTSVDVPGGLFSMPAGKPARGSGERFTTADRRAQLAVYTLRNEAGDTPGSYVRKNLKPNRRGLDYDRVTDRFFAISAFAAGKVHYTRCNFGRGGAMHCIDLTYPRSETRAWDRIVTRISLSLRPL
jgi:hypothetical protein